MGWRNTPTSYGWPSKALHWLLFLLVWSMIIGALSTEGMPKGPEKLQLMLLHKSLGTLILLLAVARLLWRWANPVPTQPVDTPRWQRATAALTHYALYLLVFAQPFSGILMSQADDRPVVFFGWFELPRIIEPNERLGELFDAAHGSIWIALIVVTALHVAAACYHHWWRRDDVLRRMTTG